MIFFKQVIFVMITCFIFNLGFISVCDGGGYIKDANGRYFKIGDKKKLSVENSVQNTALSNIESNDNLVQKYYTVIYNHIISLNSSLDFETADAITKWILYYSATYNVDPLLAVALFSQESHFSMTSFSSVGAIGIAQLMPGTAEALGVNPYDLSENIHGGILYLSQMLQKFSYAGQYQSTYAIAAYNAGPYSILENNGLPPYRETINHVTYVYNYYMDLAQQFYN